MTPISALMTPAPLPIDAEQNLAEALQRMDMLGCRHLPVVTGARLAGMLSETQILRYLMEHPGATPGDVLVTQAMGHAFAVSPETPAAVVARAMIERRLDAAAVMDQGHVAGMFTPTDAVRALAEREPDEKPAPATSEWPRRILCGIDFSAGSKNAARAALDLAHMSHGTVTLFHAFDLPISAIDAGEAAAAALGPIERETDAMLQALRRELEQQAGPSIQLAHGLGSAAETILRHARDHAFDMIVVGTHGRSGLRRVFLGSVAENVLRHAPCPVLVVRRAD